MRLRRRVSACIAPFLYLFLCSPIWAGEADLVWSTFLGGSDYDLGYDIAVDGQGDVYLTGVVTSDDFPQKSGLTDTTHGGRDLLVAKMVSTGDSLIYATLLGGEEDDEGKGIHVDANGAALVTGVTNSEDFPTTAGALDTSYNGGRDVVLVRLSPLEGSLEVSTFVGGSASDWGNDLAVDQSGYVWVTGHTNSPDFPTTSGAFDTAYHGGLWDVFAVRLGPMGSFLEYATFIGGEGVDNCHAIALDGASSVYLAGSTSSADFPVTLGAYDSTHNGEYDVFLVKLAPWEKTLSYSTLLGGELADYAMSLAVDHSGCACLTGKTISADFPITPGVCDETHSPGYNADVFVTKFDATGHTLEFSTFLGGTANDEGRDIALDGRGNIYLTGWTYSGDFPATAGAYCPTHSGFYSDAFLVRLNASGSVLEYGTFLGGNRDDLSWALTVDGHGQVYLTGESKSPDFPTTPGAYSTDLTGDYADVFVAKLNLSTTPVEFHGCARGVPEAYALLRNYPNPFNTSTEISYQIPKAGHVTLKIFNTLGQKVRTLVDDDQEPGEYVVHWDGRDAQGQEIATGVYFCRLWVGEVGSTIKMLLLR